ncbi:hypothetical protein F9C07_6998 [Aspergillus flavus]|uniref:Uncharacterized protein n=1 Tax=Aspergillus flavus (strain ATCC 200026 / FGSC A1120 / IAM 13836 / NRRL 3357 / JCM 12722 / SRRC 167) TaxID=332952 RepID=A0A7U2MLW3_ASPFN|nr:hypothetical protein F9C07_6998 [Aspergillus flavus]
MCRQVCYGGISQPVRWEKKGTPDLEGGNKKKRNVPLSETEDQTKNDLYSHLLGVGSGGNSMIHLMAMTDEVKGQKMVNMILDWTTWEEWKSLKGIKH